MIPAAPDYLKHYDVRETGERLYLQTLTPDTMSDDYLDWLQDDEVTQLLEIRHAPKQTHDDVVRFVQSNLESPDFLLLGMFLKDDDRHVGNIKLGPVHWRYLRGEIGLMIGDKNLWGQGYAAEAIQILTVIAFKTLGMHRLQAGCYASHTASYKSFEKAGFQKEGLLSDYWIIDGQRENHIMLGLVNSAQAA